MRATLALAVLLAGCLPDALSDAEVQARIAKIQGDAGSEVNGATALCGNGVVDPDEACDDKNALSCDGCEKCHIRSVFNVNGSKALAIVQSTGPLQVDASGNFAYELWFRPHKAPNAFPGGSFTFFAYFGEFGTSDPQALAVTLGISRPELVSTAMYPACIVSKPATAGPAKDAEASAAVGVDPIVPDTWHHMRCVYHGKDGKVEMSVDGKGPSSAKTFGKLASGGAFSKGSWLLFGQLPSETKKGGSAFEGELDELRIVGGGSADDWKSLKRRYEGNEADTLALYHMDSKGEGRKFPDSSSHQLDADQATLSDSGKIPTISKQDVALPVLPDSCYGFADADEGCKGANTPPWCK